MIIGIKLNNGAILLAIWSRTFDVVLCNSENLGSSVDRINLKLDRSLTIKFNTRQTVYMTEADDQIFVVAPSYESILVYDLETLSPLDEVSLPLEEGCTRWDVHACRGTGIVYVQDLCLRNQYKLIIWRLDPYTGEVSEWKKSEGIAIFTVSKFTDHILLLRWSEENNTLSVEVYDNKESLFYNIPLPEQIKYPQYITESSKSGNLLISQGPLVEEQINGTLFEINTAGEILKTLDADSFGDKSVAVSIQGIASDRNGNIFLLHSSPGRVSVVDSSFTSMAILIKPIPYSKMSSEIGRNAQESILNLGDVNYFLDFLPDVELLVVGTVDVESHNVINFYKVDYA